MTSPAAPPCKACDGELPPGIRFCPQCGRALHRGVSHGGERRQITVLFCDLMDSTNLAHRIDPEDFHEVIGAYQAWVAQVVRELDGHIGQFLGDGVLVYFGYPSAHEDDALRAVNAAVRIRAGLPALEQEIYRRVPQIEGQHVKLRFGVFTGPVVLSPTGTGRQEPQALGDTVNLAARLQTAAGPNEILVSDATHRLLADAFVTEAVDLRSLKGISETVTVWRVIQPAGQAQRRAAASPSREAPLIGRASELGGLLLRWERVQRGHGQALLVVGEPGVGKTRLLQALRAKLTAEDAGWIECQSSALHLNSAFHPVVPLLERFVDLRRDEPLDLQLQRIEAVLHDDKDGPPLRQSMPLVTNLLSLALPPSWPAEAMGSEELRHRTLEWLSRWLIGGDRREPTVILVEDLHWADDSTRELLRVLMERIGDKPVLLVMTARADFDSPWPRLERIMVHPLHPPQTEALIRQIAGERDLPADVVEEIASRTDGVPLFVEELTRAVVEDSSDNRNTSMHSVPFTIQDLLTARIDRLGPARPLAQVASVLGRQFPRALLELVASLAPADFERQLGAIVDADLVHCEDPTRGFYAFRHALIRDVAYQSLLRADRRDYHARIATILEAQAPGAIDAAPELIALHCEEGGMIERAVVHYAAAGRALTRQSAHVEAGRHLRRAIELLARLPRSHERDQREFELQMSLGPALIATHGYGDPAAERAFARAHALSKEIEEGPQRIYATYGLSTYYQARADLKTSMELAEEGRAIAVRIGDRPGRMIGHIRLGLSLFYLGQPSEALAHHRQAAELYVPAEHRHLAFVHGQDPGALAAIYSALALWTLGLPQGARASCERARQLAHGSEHPHTRAFIAAFSAVLHHLLLEPDRVEALAAESITLSEEHGFTLWVGFSGVLRGWARAMSGSSAGAGIDEIRRGLERLTSIGTVTGQAYFLGLLADAQMTAGDAEGALDSLEKALSFSQSTGIRYWQPELLRLRAEIVRRCDSTEAIAGFARAMELARSQGARSHELRIATSTSRLLQELGRSGEALALLRPLCESLAPHGECRDLREATSLLETLA